MNNGYMVAIDLLEGRGDLPDLEAVRVSTEEDADFQGENAEVAAMREVSRLVSKGVLLQNIYVFPIGERRLVDCKVTAPPPPPPITEFFFKKGK